MAGPPDPLKLCESEASLSPPWLKHLATLHVVGRKCCTIIMSLSP